MHGYRPLFLLLTPFSFVKLFKKNDWWVVTVLKNIESAQAKPFLKSTTGPQRSPPPNQLHFKRGGSALLFENCSSGSVTLREFKNSRPRLNHSWKELLFFFIWLNKRNVVFRKSAITDNSWGWLMAKEEIKWFCIQSISFYAPYSFFSENCISQ